MDVTEENFGNEGFEEVSGGSQTSQEGQRPSSGKNRPDFRIVQPDTGKDGKPLYKNVGGMWKNVSKNGNEFYTLMIGNLKLLVFKNENK